jgi:hypothetical protein
MGGVFTQAGPISDVEFAAALFLPTQFRMYDVLAEDGLLFGISARGTHRNFQALPVLF